MADTVVGQKAPDFTLPDTDRKPRKLSEFLGKKLVLAFFPGAFKHSH
jgi:peroxiredoxin